MVLFLYSKFKSVKIKPVITKEEVGKMQSTRLSVTAVASDKVKHQKLNFYINGKISNFSRIENVQFSRVDEGGDFIYSLSENMECIIERSQTVVSVEKELKRYQKKMTGLTAEDKKNGFVNCVKGTYDFIYGVSGENEIEFSKDKLFTGFLLSGGTLKAVSTNFNSFYRIRDGRVDNFFEKIEKPSYAVDKPKDENYSPSKGVIKEFETDDLKEGDIFLFATTNANTRIDEEIILGFHDKDDDSEETAWHVVNEAGKHSIEDNFIVIAVSIEAFSEHGFLETVTPIINEEEKSETEEKEEEEPSAAIQSGETPENSNLKKQGLFAAAASIFKPGKKNVKKTIDTEDDLVETSEVKDVLAEDEPEEQPVGEKPIKQTQEDTSFKKRSSLTFPGMGGNYKKLNVKRPRFMKRRMNIYLKRIVSIIVVLVLMAGIVWGMYHLLKLIFGEKEEVIEISPTPTVSATLPPTTPPPTPSPTPTPTPPPSEEPEEAYIEYTVQAGDTLSKISATFYNGENHVDEIVAYNENITSANLINVGQVIKLPILFSEDPDGN